MLTLSINGIQIDIQAAIIISSSGRLLSFQHIYFARVNPIGDVAENNTNPCSNNPCQNDGFCVVVSNTIHECIMIYFFNFILYY